MEKIYQYLDIDINKSIYRRIRAVQGDTKSRYILVNLYQNNKLFNLSNCSIKVYGLKSDEKKFFNNATILDPTNGKFEIELTSQALAAVGELEIQLVVLGGAGERITSFKFYIDIEKSIVDDAAIESTNEFTALTQALGQVQNIDNRFTEVHSQLEHKANKAFVTYEDFGAKGDGVTDDYISIRQAHLYANEHNIKVVTHPSKTYYIKNITDSIAIRTPVDWNTSNFIIDDREVTDSTALMWLFDIQPTKEYIDVSNKVTSFNKNTKSIASASQYGHCLLHVINSDKRIYIRKGVNSDNGYYMQELVELIDGRVVSDINWDFAKVTSAYIYPIDDEIITVEGGTFTTLINTLPNIYGNGVNRGIRCRRSNTVIRNIKHFMHNGNTLTSKPYNGWIYLYKSFNVVLENVTLSGHKIFYENKNDTLVAMGTYDLCISECINIHLNNVIQSNSITSSEFWGVVVSNYVKDIYLTNCKLSRYDCHRELTNINIDRCELGTIQFVGFGLAKIRNTTVIGWTFVNLRGDYGASWNGVIDIDNCKLVNTTDTTRDYSIVFARNDSKWDFGYKCYYPNIIVRNLHIVNNDSASVLTFINNKATGSEPIGIDVELDYDTEVARGRFPYIWKEYAIFDNITTSSPMKISIMYDHPIYCYRDKKHTVVKDINGNTNTPRPNIFLRTNYDITIKNIDLSKCTYDMSNQGALQINNFHNGAISYNTYRMLPTIHFINCKLDRVNTELPMILKLDKCQVNKLSFQFTHEQPIVYANATEFNETLVYHRNVQFADCIFNATEGLTTVAQLKQIHSWIGVVEETYINSKTCFRASLKMYDCILNFDKSLIITPSIQSKYGISSEFLSKVVNFDIFDIV